MSKNDLNPSIEFKDVPIEIMADDKLNRANYSRAVASTIANWDSEESAVFALYGEWGSGKTTVKNFIKESLSNEHPDQPEIVEFNPWMWSAQDSIIKSFFYSISDRLGKRTDSKHLMDFAKKIRLFANLVLVGKGTLNFTLKLSFFIIGTILILSNSLTSLDSIHHLFKYFGFFTGSVLVLLSLLFNISKSLSDHYELKYNLYKKSDHALKIELESHLRLSRKKLLIIIDDLDRLNSKEIKNVFQLIKTNADFKNVFYLLLFQKDIVEKGLSDEIPDVTGEDFLDKIVQVGLNIPQIDRKLLETEILYPNMDKILKKYEYEESFDNIRWGKINSSGFRPYFNTLRNVKRYLISLDFQFEKFRSIGDNEINAVDLIILEV